MLLFLRRGALVQPRINGLGATQSFPSGLLAPAPNRRRTSATAPLGWTRAIELYNSLRTLRLPHGALRVDAELAAVMIPVVEHERPTPLPMGTF